MSLERRELLRLGAAGAAGLILSSAAGSQALPGLLLPKPATSPYASVPAQANAVPQAPAGINPQLFAKAKAALTSARSGRAI